MKPTRVDLGPFIQPEGRIHYGDDAASFALAREMRPIQIVARFTVDGEPVSKSRARFTKRGSKTHAYTPEKTHVAEQRMAWAFRAASPGWKPDKETTFGVCAIFFHAHNQRRDVDNMLKLVCDGLNGVAWVDDVQVEEVAGRRGHTLDDPRTEVLIYRIGTRDRPSRKCVRCGEDFPIYRSTGERKYCSRDCSLAARREARTAACANCGAQFEKNQRTALYCSIECCWDAKSVNATCSDCGVAYKVRRSDAHRRPRCTECQKRRNEARKVACLHGHLWAEHGKRKPNGKRYCAECNRLRVAANRSEPANPGRNPA